MVNNQDSKTYRPKNLKFVLTIILLSILSVAILLYLLSINTFTPFNIDNGYNWINILTFTFLLLLFLLSLFCWLFCALAKSIKPPLSNFL